jgi:serine/threonine protein kinase/tetratricopeptide (TPR) repeat protein
MATVVTFGASDEPTRTSGVGPAVRPVRQEGDTGPLHAGQEFGSRYRVIRLLGIGGMGAVYHAWDADLGIAVALKVIRLDPTANQGVASELERRFKQELVLARQVTHKNVVRIHDMGEIDGIRYITMPYLEGEDLATVLRRGRVDVAMALRLIRDIAAGLQAAHEAGIVHRDLKPANIMVVDGRAVIMDFGIARSADGLLPGPAEPGTPADLAAAATTAMTAAGTIVGTVRYMAPEQARGQLVDQRADVYALGLIFLDALLGTRPGAAAGENALDELKRRTDAAPPLARTIDPAIPQGVEQIIARCLEPDPANRFHTSADLVAALERLDDDGALIPIRRAIGLPLVGAIVTLLLALSAGIWWYQRQLIPDAPHDDVSVIVADVRNETGDPAFDNALGQTLRRGLEEATFVNAFERSRISAAFGVPPPAALDDTSAREFAAKQGVGVVLSSAIERQRGGFSLTVKAVETISGTVLSDLRGFARGRDQVLGTAASLIAKVRRALGDETSESAQLFAMRSVSASSLAVLAHYADAIEAQTRGRFEDARQSYLKAIALDPEFGLGYQGLAAMARNLGQRAESERYISDALRHLDGMTERERFATRGLYYRIMGDSAQCAAEYGQLLARYPADSVAHNQRALCLTRLRRMREATEAMREAVRMLPGHMGYRSNLAMMLAKAGEFEAAAGEGAVAAQQEPRALLVVAYSQIGRGLLTEAEATYRAIGSAPDGASTAAMGLADLAVYEGRFSDAVRILQDSALADIAAKQVGRAAVKLAAMAHAHLRAGREADAIAAAGRAVATDPSMSVRFLAARVFAEAGALDKARALATPMASELAIEPQAHGKILEGLIALHAGRPREAITTLTAANGMLDTWFGRFDLGRAYLAAGALPQADSEFDRCLIRRGEALSLMDEGPTYGHLPIVFYYQGLVREGLKTAGFAESYGQYLRIRGQSSQDPLVAEVRGRLATAR